MKTVECACGRHVRPCNLGRHVRAQHTPVMEEAEWGTKVIPPPNPIKIGRGKDRRYDESFPRGEGPHRYRIYRVRGGDLQLVATAPDAESMGFALAHTHAEGEYIADDSVGVLDTLEDPGHWVVNPWTLGRKSHA